MGILRVCPSLRFAERTLGRDAQATEEGRAEWADSREAKQHVWDLFANAAPPFVTRVLDEQLLLGERAGALLVGCGWIAQEVLEGRVRAEHEEVLGVAVLVLAAWLWPPLSPACPCPLSSR